MILQLFFIMACSLQVRALSLWPEGTYSLPRPITGCPPEWREGLRYQDTENVDNSNAKSKQYHLSGTVDNHGIRQEFCTKLDENDGQGDWPPGQYCIYRYGAKCPVGFKEGWILWDDENDEMIDAESLYRGVVPAGVYEKDTLIYTCCMTNGNKKVPISLPLSQPFYLLAYGSTDCQQVRGAKVTSEFVKWDDEDRMNRNANSLFVPFAVKKDRWNTKIFYCFYEFDIFGSGNAVVCQNSTEFDNSQSAKSQIVAVDGKKSELPGFATTLPRSSGLAVAIGSTVAGVICGTAVLAYFVKHYISQKADEIHKADLSDDEEEIFPMPDEIW